ncbi:MAG: hypothetical protein GWP91_09545 [Rhodobacterales bacterium]|nr:hypothetical protein [Rhodobacterales bacterium]
MTVVTDSRDSRRFLVSGPGHGSWRFVLFHDKRHPSEMGADEVRAFLAHLATQRKVASSTHDDDLHPCREKRPGRSGQPRG